MAGISNEAIEDFFEKVNDEDLKNNFIGVFPSNYINRFISYHSIMKDRSKVKYPFIIMNTDRSDRAGTHWWSFLDLHKKKRSFYLIALVLKDLKSSSLIMTEKFLIKCFLVLINFKRVIAKLH